MTYGLAGFLALIAVELWLLRRRVGQRLGALSRLEDDIEVRISSLTRSMELLTDTTETGFNLDEPHHVPVAVEHRPES